MSALSNVALFLMMAFIVDSEAKHRQFYFFNVGLKVNKKYLNESEVKMPCTVNSRDRPCTLSPSVNVRLLQDVAHPYVHIQGRDLTTNKITLDQVVVGCSLSKNIGMDIFMKLGLEMVSRNINFNISCPFRKGIYTVKSFHHPYGLLLNFFQINQTQRYIATIKNRFGKTMENITMYQFDFEVIEID